MSANRTNGNCHCDECTLIHAEFIYTFNKMPNMSHEDAQEIKRKREENVKSWELAVELSGGDALYQRKIGE